MNRLDKQLPDLNDRSQNAGTPVVALLCLSVFGLSRLTILPVCLLACLPALPALPICLPCLICPPITRRQLLVLSDAVRLDGCRRFRRRSSG